MGRGRVQLRDQARGAGRSWRGVWVGISGLIAIAVAGVIGSAPSPLRAQPHITRAGHEAEAKNMRLLGYNDLQARSAYQPVIQRQGNRWIAYVGHHGGMALNPLTGKEESNGTSIVDVTDPANPNYLPGQPELPLSHSGRAGGRRGRRGANGARVQRPGPAQGRPREGLPLAHPRQLRA
jgi:hypothetical protein